MVEQALTYLEMQNRMERLARECKRKEEELHDKNVKIEKLENSVSNKRPQKPRKRVSATIINHTPNKQFKPPQNTDNYHNIFQNNSISITKKTIEIPKKTITKKLTKNISNKTKAKTTVTTIEKEKPKLYLLPPFSKNTTTTINNTTPQPKNTDKKANPKTTGATQNTTTTSTTAKTPTFQNININLITPPKNKNNSRSSSSSSSTTSGSRSPSPAPSPNRILAAENNDNPQTDNIQPPTKPKQNIQNYIENFTITDIPGNSSEQNILDFFKDINIEFDEINYIPDTTLYTIPNADNSNPISTPSLNNPISNTTPPHQQTQLYKVLNTPQAPPTLNITIAKIQPSPRISPKNNSITTPHNSPDTPKQNITITTAPTTPPRIEPTKPPTPIKPKCTLSTCIRESISIPSEQPSEQPNQTTTEKQILDLINNQHKQQLTIQQLQKENDSIKFRITSLEAILQGAKGDL